MPVTLWQLPKATPAVYYCTAGQLQSATYLTYKDVQQLNMLCYFSLACTGTRCCICASAWRAVFIPAHVDIRSACCTTKKAALRSSAELQVDRKKCCVLLTHAHVPVAAEVLEAV